MREKILTIPNCITMFRIIGACGLIFTEAFSKSFFILYTFCGISDVVDGWVARFTKKTTELGAKMDSIADLLFYSVMIIKIFPELCATLPVWIWCVVWGAVLLRVVTYVMVAIRYKRLASLHTYMNKMNGLAAFGIPYFLKTVFAVPYCAVGCIIAGIAAVEEFLMHVLAKEYPEGTKTILTRIAG